MKSLLPILFLALVPLLTMADQSSHHHYHPYPKEQQHKEESKEAEAKYKYSYKVSSEEAKKQKVDFEHTEGREGTKANGEYKVLLPDGRVQKVIYKVEGESGFIADVSYEGHPAQHSHPEPAKHIYHAMPVHPPVAHARHEPAAKHHAHPLPSAAAAHRVQSPVPAAHYASHPSPAKEHQSSPHHSKHTHEKAKYNPYG